MAGHCQILHVSADFPDPLVSAKTAVIARLLDLAGADFTHHVISLNRQTPSPADLIARRIARNLTPFDRGEALHYLAPPRGLLHRACLMRLAHWLAQRLATAPPQLLVGWKLTVEGLVVARAAQLLGVPYVVALQGNTDGKIMALRPDLRPHLAAAFHGAAMVMAFAPWSLQQAEARLGRRAGPVRLLPFPLAEGMDQPLASPPGGDGLVSVFHLAHWRNKNLAGLARACRLLRAAGTPVRLAVIGGGSAEDEAICARIAALAGGDLRLEGPLPPMALRARLGRASGLVLASRRESFGLVLIEALFAGLPVIHPRGAAIDGWLPAAGFVQAVHTRSPSALARAMRLVLDEEAALKQAVACWQRSDEAQRFTRRHIARSFTACLREAIESGAG